MSQPNSRVVGRDARGWVDRRGDIRVWSWDSHCGTSGNLISAAFAPGPEPSHTPTPISSKTFRGREGSAPRLQPPPLSTPPTYRIPRTPIFRDMRSCINTNVTFDEFSAQNQGQERQLQAEISPSRQDADLTRPLLLNPTSPMTSL